MGVFVFPLIFSVGRQLSARSADNGFMRTTMPKLSKQKLSTGHSSSHKAAAGKNVLTHSQTVLKEGWAIREARADLARGRGVRPAEKAGWIVDTHADGVLRTRPAVQRDW